MCTEFTLIIEVLYVEPDSFTESSPAVKMGVRYVSFIIKLLLYRRPIVLCVIIAKLSLGISQ